MSRIKKILVSQPQPENDKSPYFDLAEKHNLKIDFRPFIHVEGISTKEFRQSKVDLSNHSAVIFTSKTSIDHYFRIADETRVTIPDTMKYFCISESTAYYLQKYIVYRKRKIFFGKGKMEDLVEIMMKHKDENFLVPLSAAHKEEIPVLLEKHKFKFTKSILYKTECSDLSDLADVNYDVLVFYSPSGIKSLLQNFPDFKQNNTKIASFGDKTARAVEEAGLRLDIKAPAPQAPSMTMALESFIEQHNKNGKS
ncbi:MAG: uroporphyrinogen-III synthase [Bacteroidales bacterium]|nr:uroporphyrinogen-III synthase [Bacteroidales bacterium]MDT8431159.1 uroporphyrinogen-III synthase [Bacteroidales bacterium]